MYAVHNLALYNTNLYIVNCRISFKIICIPCTMYKCEDIYVECRYDLNSYNTWVHDKSILSICEWKNILKNNEIL